MITIKANDVLYGLSFSHPHLNGKGKKAPERSTICSVNQWVDGGTGDSRIQGWRELVSAEVTCSRSDNFNRSVGRKKALTRALCQHDFAIGGQRPSSKCLKCGSHRTATLVLPKELRNLIWKSYWEATVFKPLLLQMKIENKKEDVLEGELLSVDIETPTELPLEYSPGLGDY